MGRIKCPTVRVTGAWDIMLFYKPSHAIILLPTLLFARPARSSSNTYRVAVERESAQSYDFPRTDAFISRYTNCLCAQCSLQVCPDIIQNEDRLSSQPFVTTSESLLQTRRYPRRTSRYKTHVACLRNNRLRRCTTPCTLRGVALGVLKESLQLGLFRLRDDNSTCTSRRLRGQWLNGTFDHPGHFDYRINTCNMGSSNARNRCEL